MRSFINAIFSLLSSSTSPESLRKNMYTPNAQVSGRPVEELEGEDRMHKKPWYSSAGSLNVSYCHHKRTPSAGSTEYWIWNGPEDNDTGLDESTTPPTFEPLSPIPPSEISKESVIYLEADKFEASPRLEPIARFVTPSIPDDVPNLTLDTSTDLDTSSTSTEPPSTPDLPSDSFSPLLRANRLALDADAFRKAPRFGMVTTTPATTEEEPRPLFGLGIFDLTRKEDPSHAFDGLGIVRVQSSPWRPRQKSKASPVKRGDDSSDNRGQDNTQLEYCHHISEVFLHDLEALFLVRDLTPSPLPLSNRCSGDEHNGGLMFEVIIEEPTTEGGERNSSSMLPPTTLTAPLPVVAAGNGSHLPWHTSTPANKNLSGRTRNKAAKPPSDLCAIEPRPSSTQLTQASSCSLEAPMPTPTTALSTASSAYALTPSSSFSSSSSSSSTTSSGIPTSGSGSRSAFVRRTCSAFTLSCHDTRSSPQARHHRGGDTVSPSASAQNLTVSVSMGSSLNIKGHGIVALELGDRSLQSHSVRDLSVVGTISSDLKRKMSVSLSRSGSVGTGFGIRV